MPKQKLYINKELKERECSCCHEIKSFDNFFINSTRSFGITETCKFCKSIVDREYREKNPDKIFERTIKRLYNITVDQYMSLLLKQEGQCAICKSEKSGNKIGEERLHIDHVEINGQKIVRGLLCENCNTALGKFKDDSETLKAALEYLQRTII